MCDVGKALSRAFSPPGTGAMLNELQGEQAAAARSSDTAAAALEAAIKQTRDASIPAIDNPLAHAAGLDQMRKMLSTQGAAWSFGNAPTAAPATATKVLMGQ